MTEFAVQCTGLTKRYGAVKAVDGVDLTVRSGETLSIVGPSGSGKTTILRIIAGFETIDAGNVTLQGVPVSTPQTSIPPERRRVGLVFQEHALFPHKTVAENVSFGLHKMPANDRRKRQEDVLDLVQLSHYAQRYPHELSGGERQRVALARSLAPKPSVLLLDEPFSGLDANLRLRIREEVKTILAASGATVIFVTHDQEGALFMGDTIAIIDNGKIEQTGAPQQVFHAPVTKFAARFLGTADFLHGTYQNGNVETEIGVFPASIEGSGECEVMTRPDDIDLAPSDDGPGTVVSRTFQGISNLYRVKLPSGAVLRAQRPHHESYAPGDRVDVRPSLHYAPRCFAADDGRLLR